MDPGLAGLSNLDLEVPDRVRRVFLLAPVLVPRGTKPAHLARAAELGGWIGERSSNYEALRAAFAAIPASGDAHVEAVRQAAIVVYERARDEALKEERERRVSGDL